MKKYMIVTPRVTTFSFFVLVAAVAGCSSSGSVPAGGTAQASVNHTASLKSEASSAPVTACIGNVLYDQVFNDNFASFPTVAGHSGQWQTSYLWGRENPEANDDAYYIDDSVVGDATQAADGITSIQKTANGLDLIASKTPSNLLALVDGHPYVSGAINSSRLFTQTYGYFSADIKLPSGKGIWPAFWLLPTVGYPPEIDIMEELGNDPAHVYETTHDTNLKVQQIQSWMSSGVSGYHVYGVAWNSQTITYYIDGGSFGSVPNISNQPMYMVLNLAVGNAASWPGAPDATTQFPATMSVQWVHGYTAAGSC